MPRKWMRKGGTDNVVKLLFWWQKGSNGEIKIMIPDGEKN